MLLPNLIYEYDMPLGTLNRYAKVWPSRVKPYPYCGRFDIEGVCQFFRTVHHYFVNPIAVLLSLVPARRITYADGPSLFGMLESLVCDARDPFMLGRQGY
jgi:hypothetical protein